MTFHRDFPFEFGTFDIRICFVFRASNFGFFSFGLCSKSHTPCVQQKLMGHGQFQQGGLGGFYTVDHLFQSEHIYDINYMIILCQ